MTPLNPTEQLILAGILVVFVAGAGILAWQGKSLDRQLAGLMPAVNFTKPQQGNRERRPIAEKTAQRRQIPGRPLSLATATAQELESLPGIGPQLAEAIVAYRRNHVFHSVDDLTNVPGIGPKRLQRIREKVQR